MTAELQDTLLKALSHWDPLNYVNLSVVRAAAAGSAHLPGIPSVHGRERGSDLVDVISIGGKEGKHPERICPVRGPASAPVSRPCGPKFLVASYVPEKSGTTSHSASSHPPGSWQTAARRAYRTFRMDR